MRAFSDSLKNTKHLCWHAIEKPKRIFSARIFTSSSSLKDACYDQTRRRYYKLSIPCGKCPKDKSLHTSHKPNRSVVSPNTSHLNVIFGNRKVSSRQKHDNT